MQTTYKEHFQNVGEASQYVDQYAPGGHAHMIWQIEQRRLVRIIDAMRVAHERIEHLDFAAGTGRVIAFVENLVDSSTGIEISEQMIEFARKRVSNATLICRDITAADAPVEQRYDLITAFRFFLNAEPALQEAGIKALTARLRSEDSRLVFNNHGNLWSLKLLLWPVHALRRRRSGYQTAGNVMTHGRVKALVRLAGLEIESVRGCNVLSERMMFLLPGKLFEALEKLLSSAPIVHCFGANILYVTKLRAQPSAAAPDTA